jgi:hypothetical protein
MDRCISYIGRHYIMHPSLQLCCAYGRWSETYIGPKRERDALAIHPEKELIVELEDGSDDDDDNEGITSSLSYSSLPSSGFTISSFSGCMVSESCSLLRPVYASDHLSYALHNQKDRCMI